MAGAAAGAVLVAVATAWPALSGTDVHIGISGWPRFPPLHANWRPGVTATSILPVLVGIAVIVLWPRIARLRWPAFLGALFAATWAWVMSLALVDGLDGLGEVFTRKGEYLYDAGRVTSIPAMLPEFVDRIPLSAPDHWWIHVAGHPPGALISFVGLDRIGISDPVAVGFVVATIGCTAVVAAAITLRLLAGEHWARRAGPWWVLAPAAVWIGVTADAAFAAVAAWGLAALAYAGVTRSRLRTAVAGLGAGLLLGFCVYLSYGLVLLGIPAVAILLLTRRLAPLAWALLGALAIAAAFTLAGFAWWEAYGVLHDRYYAGIASDRPYGYWVWANVAAWTFTVGLATWAGLPAAASALLRRPVVRDGRFALSAMVAAGLTCIVAATLSGMSKAEVERIWLPFTLWVLPAAALLPERLRRPFLVVQVVTALLIQHLLMTRW
ncbi:UNVERIFIED_CONTAM: membrane protein [Mumia flava]